MDIRENGAPRVNEPAAGCGTCRAHTIDRNIQKHPEECVDAWNDRDNYGNCNSPKVTFDIAHYVQNEVKKSIVKQLLKTSIFFFKICDRFDFSMEMETLRLNKT